MHRALVTALYFNPIVFKMFQSNMDTAQIVPFNNSRSIENLKFLFWWFVQFASIHLSPMLAADINNNGRFYISSDD